MKLYFFAANIREGLKGKCNNRLSLKVSFVFLTLALLLIFVFFSYASGLSGQPLSIELQSEVPDDDDKLVNINTASLAELDTLPGIGPAYAQRIIDDRPYSSVDDLLEVRGIGPKTLEKLRDLVTIGEKAGPTQPQVEPEPEPENPEPEEPGLVDLNTATVNELDSLPGIGPAYAQRIIVSRPFLEVEDLLEVQGIGPKTLEKLADLVTVDVEQPADQKTPDEKLDINSCSFQKLQSVPGIGVNKAMWIEKNRPISDFDQLLELEGFSVPLVSQIQKYLKIVESEKSVVTPKKKKAILLGQLKTNLR